MYQARLEITQDPHVSVLIEGRIAKLHWSANLPTMLEGARHFKRAIDLGVGICEFIRIVDTVDDQVFHAFLLEIARLNSCQLYGGP